MLWVLRRTALWRPETYVKTAEYRGSYMSAHVLLNLLNELRKKEIKCEACRAFYLFFATSSINSIMQEHKMLDSFYHMSLRLL